jgi:hypothetical protein
MKPSDKEKGPSPPSRPSSRVPEQARVPKPGTLDTLLDDIGPSKITSRARIQATTKLHDMAERIRSGHHTGLEALRYSGFGQTTRGLVECKHYLPANRFDWWDIHRQGLIPRTSPIGIFWSDPSLRDVLDIFHSEFCSPLSTVVGADLHLVESIGAGRSLMGDSARWSIPEYPGLD